jgi:hypothetical protein
LEAAQGSRPDLSQDTTLWERVKSLLKRSLLKRANGPSGSVPATQPSLRDATALGRLARGLKSPGYHHRPLRGHRTIWRGRHPSCVPGTHLPDAGVASACTAVILVVAVRPKHSPLWRTKFVGLTAFRFWNSIPGCCHLSSALNSPPIDKRAKVLLHFLHGYAVGMAFHPSASGRINPERIASLSPGLDRRGVKGRRSYPG